MKFANVIAACGLVLPTALATTNSIKARLNPFLEYKKLISSRAKSAATPPQARPAVKRRASSSQFLNAKSTKYAVNGTGIPDVDFDIGESYAGLMPIASGGNSTKLGELFFWFFPSSAEERPKEIIIWLNGGPGCSSMLGLMQENGPFLWQDGTRKPIANPWSWNHLTNIIYIEQPLGTGFSNGPISIKNEDDLSKQFMGFWRNLVDTFGLHGYKIYITGESYAGAYCPYIGSNMLDANDPTYFDVNGMLIYDPLIAHDVAGIAPMGHFAKYWRNVMPFNDTTAFAIANASKACGYDAFTDRYLTFPPSGQQPDLCDLPGVSADCSEILDGCNVFGMSFSAMVEMNQGFNIYQVAQLLPAPDSIFSSSGREIYFNRADVKQAIHAPLDINWTVCSDESVFPRGDNSDPSSYRAIPNVIDRTKNVHIFHGAMDMVLLANGTLLGIQNMTWGGQMGFQTMPHKPLFVPRHQTDPSLVGASMQGVLGTWHSERGLTWGIVELSGHMMPGFQGAATFRQIEVMLGHVDSLSSTKPFPMDNTDQPDPSTLGSGTAWYGFWDSSKGIYP